MALPIKLFFLLSVADLFSSVILCRRHTSTVTILDVFMCQGRATHHSRGLRVQSWRASASNANGAYFGAVESWTGSWRWAAVENKNMN